MSAGPAQSSYRLAARRALPWRVALWLLASGLGCVWLARAELAQQREAFETDARIVHRLLSQQVVQHDAILRTLALLQPAAGATERSASPEQRLPALYPQILGVLRREPGQPWPDEALRRAEDASRVAQRPALADADFAAQRYRVVLAAEPVSFALALHAQRMAPWAEWPMAVQTSLVQVALEYAGQRLVLQPGRPGTRGWWLDFRKVLAAESQPFDVVLTRQVRWLELPWLNMTAWTLAAALLLAGQWMLQRQRTARRRAEELLRLGQVSRLNALGELAAGMAHELNQPLTALLANTQAARRLLADDAPDIEVARHAMTQAAEQARRASDVVTRLRRTVERPDRAAELRPVDLLAATRGVLDLLGPECARRGVNPRVQAPDAPVVVQADPVALEQIVHNLLMNALQALEQVPEAARALTLSVGARGAQGTLTIADTGPGIAPDLLPHLFEPFVTTREGGLGLGLSLCESLASGMGGTLAVAPVTPRGAAFTLSLPLADLHALNA